jgi:uncharacterized lipoprotein YajG
MKVTMMLIICALLVGCAKSTSTNEAAPEDSTITCDAFTLSDVISKPKHHEDEQQVGICVVNGVVISVELIN